MQKKSAFIIEKVKKYRKCQALQFWRWEFLLEACQKLLDLFLQSFWARR